MRRRFRQGIQQRVQMQTASAAKIQVEHAVAGAIRQSLIGILPCGCETDFFWKHWL